MSPKMKTTKTADGGWKPEEIAHWMGEAIFLRRECLSEGQAVSEIRVLFGEDYVSPDGRTIAEPIRQALHTMFGAKLRWDPEHRRWSAME